jgi:hypothetical protein
MGDCPINTPMPTVGPNQTVPITQVQMHTISRTPTARLSFQFDRSGLTCATRGFQGTRSFSMSPLLLSAENGLKASGVIILVIWANPSLSLKSAGIDFFVASSALAGLIEFSVT